MNCGCNCFGIAASSRRPVKRYNALVPDIFPRTAPAFSNSIDPAVERKFKKLCEYLEKNPHREPKVSSRAADGPFTESFDALCLPKVRHFSSGCIQ